MKTLLSSFIGRWLFATTAALLLCASSSFAQYSPETQRERDKDREAIPNYTDADYGPLPENFEALVTKYVTDRMKDASKAQVLIGPTPSKVPYAEPDGATIKYHPAWAVTVTVNATNSNGSNSNYVFVVYLHGNQVIGWTPPG